MSKNLQNPASRVGHPKYEQNTEELQKLPFSTDAAFLLAVRSFLLTVELFSLTIDNFSFLLAVGASLLTALAFCLQLKLFCLQCESASNKGLKGL